MTTVTLHAGHLGDEFITASKGSMVTIVTIVDTPHRAIGRWTHYDVKGKNSLVTIVNTPHRAIGGWTHYYVKGENSLVTIVEMDSLLRQREE